MNEVMPQKPPTWFYVVAGVALLWNLMGVMAYIGQVTMDDAALADFTPAQRAVIEGVPAWATAGFAIAVFAGVAGSALLLLRKAHAGPAFIVSLVAVLLTQAHWLFMSGAMSAFGPGEMAMPVATIIIAIALVLFANVAKSKGWTT